MSIDILDDKFEINRWVRPVLELLPYLNSGNDYFLTLLMASFVGPCHCCEELRRVSSLSLRCVGDKPLSVVSYRE